jgi:hypothetical protein
MYLLCGAASTPVSVHLPNPSNYLLPISPFLSALPFSPCQIPLSTRRSSVCVVPSTGEREQGKIKESSGEASDCALRCCEDAPPCFHHILRALSVLSLHLPPSHWYLPSCPVVPHSAAQNLELSTRPPFPLFSAGAPVNQYSVITTNPFPKPFSPRKKKKINPL